MRFSKGMIPWNKGKPIAESTRSLLSSIATGRKSPNKGRTWKIKVIRKIQVNRGGPKGKPWSEDRRKAQENVVLKPRARVKARVKAIIKNEKLYSPIWHELRKLIYKRDNYLCQECGEHCHNTSKRKIQCHHIDYDTLNNDLSNLITLCVSCHAKTNFKRENWINHYIEKMKVKKSHGSNYNGSDS